MMNELKILKDEPTVSSLLHRVANIDTLPEYYNHASKLPSSIKAVNSTIKVRNEPSLKFTPKDDADSAIEIYKYLGDIGRTFGSDPRLWVYLTHFNFRSYVQNRWKLPILDIKNDKTVNMTKALIAERWFYGGSKAYAHNAIARLWWAAYLTKSPWEMGANYKSLHNQDDFVYTKILFSTQDVHTSLIEREVFSSPVLFFATLEFLRTHPDYASKEKIQALSKELNLIAGFKRISSLSLTTAIDLVKSIALDLNRE